MIGDLFVGIFSGVLTIWAAIYFLSPDIRISKVVLHRPQDGGELDWCFKFHNNGWRSAIDLKYRVVLIVENIRAPENHNTYIFKLKASGEERYRANSMVSTVVRFCGKLYDPEDNGVMVQHDNVRQILTSGDLEEMLKLGTKCYLRIEIIASDGRTGIRSYFSSGEITLNEIYSHRDYGFYYDDADVYRKSEYSGPPPERKYPEMRTNNFNSNIFIIKAIRLFYDLISRSYRRFSVSKI